MNIKELCQAIIDDKQLQKSSGGIKWDNCTPEYAMHIYYMDHPNIRTKPASKTIDLTVLIDSSIDCEQDINNKWQCKENK